MDIFNILTLLGGLALFLYGMETMGNGLTTVAGGRLEGFLEKLTGNLVKGVLLGAAVTAIIQSSSATTVMVVALVNAGVMKLEQAVGVIMGANIGTTVTSWLLSLTGIESGNVYIQLFKPSSFTPILALIAVIILFTSKNEGKKGFASILIGFAVLMFGMDTMTAAVAPLQDVPAFANLFLLFSNPLIGMLVGALLTAIIQSSSASVGILQALCGTGAVTYGAAIPIIMGQNIGTCVTALLSSIGASKNAKRAATIHLSFNVISTLFYMIAFYTVNAFHPFSFLNQAAEPFSIAIIHSIFNVAATLLLLPFSKALVKLVKLIIRDDPADHDLALDPVEEDLKRLNPNFLEQAGFAVEQAHTTAVSMAKKAYNSLDAALHLLSDFNVDRFDYVVRLEQQIDRYEDALDNYLMQISTAGALNDRDNRNLTIMIHSVNDLERISDHAINIAEHAAKKHESNGDFSEEAMADVQVYAAALRDIVARTVKAFADSDVAYAHTIEPLEQRIDELDTEFSNRHIRRLREGKCTMELGLIISDLYNNMERVADHCSNIGVCMIQYSDKLYTSHQYLNQLNRDRGDFAKAYKSFTEQYRIP